MLRDQIAETPPNGPGMAEVLQWTIDSWEGLEVDAPISEKRPGDRRRRPLITVP
jgi:hypothetical protein